MKIFDVLIIGCGSIGGGFDMQGDGLNQPRTHAGAFDRHDRFSIAGCIEPIDVVLKIMSILFRKIGKS